MRTERLIMIHLENPVARAVAEQVIEKSASRLIVSSDGAAVRKRKDPIRVFSGDVFGIVTGGGIDPNHQLIRGLTIVGQNLLEVSRAVDRFGEDCESRPAQA